MSDNNAPVDRIVSKLSRRRALAGVATLATAGGSLVVVGEPAQASVSVDGLDVSDATFERESVTPVVDVSVSYQYDASLEPVNALEFALLVDGTEVASDELITDKTALDGQTTLSGTVTDSQQWSESDFQPTVGEAVTREIQFTLEFRVVTSEGTTIVDDEASDTATVEVSHPQQSALVASVGGRGTIRAADE